MTRPLQAGMRRTADWVAPEPMPADAEGSVWRSARELLSRLSSSVVLRCLLLVAIFSLAAVPPLDPDLWWHLANGRLMVTTASIPHADLYSFSAAGQPWVMHEWLADLGMYGLYRLGGLPLLVAVFALIVTGTALCLYWLLRRSGMVSSLAVVLTMVGTLAGSTAWGARPQVLNPFLTGLLLIGLVHYREGRLRAWMLPPFIWLWANLHSGFVAGVIISGLFAAAEAFDAWRGSRSAMSRPRLVSLAIAIAVSVAVSALNPFGLQALLFAVGTLTSPLIQNNIQEWASPDFHSIAGLMLEGIILVLLAGLLTGRVRARTSEWVLAFALLYLAFSSQRHVELFVLGGALLYGASATALFGTIRSFLGGGREMRTTSRQRSRPLLGLANLVLLIGAGGAMIGYRALPNLQPVQEEVAIASALPVSAAAAVERIGRPAKIFNYYDYGGYLIWTLYPKGDRVYIDGRVEVYGPRIFSQYLRVNYLASGWQSVVARADPDVVILPSGHPLVQLLEADKKWQQFSRDPVATVLTRVGFAP